MIGSDSIKSMSKDFETFQLGDVTLQSGVVLRAAQLAYKTYGELAKDGSNAVLLPTFYTGTHVRNEGFFGRGRAIDPAKHFVVSVNLFGNGLSSSPSNSPAPQNGPGFPDITLWDNVACQRRLLTERLGVQRLALVAGWSMAGCQAYQWAVQYPKVVEAILPFCASARTSAHNFVFLEGVKAALCADATWQNGHYSTPPVRGLEAFGRVYAGWAFSQTFYREGLYRKLGNQTPQDLLDDWAQDHANNWDANDLLAKLKSWQLNDVSANSIHKCDFAAALGSIRAKSILLPCTQDLYFPPADNEIEAGLIPNVELRVYDSPWGHCVANPGNDSKFTKFLDRCIADLLFKKHG